MARGRKTSLTISLTPEERQTLRAAASHDRPFWGVETCPDDLTPRRGAIDHRHCRDGRDQPALFYKWAQRFLAQGVAGLVDRPGRGHRPRQGQPQEPHAPAWDNVISATWGSRRYQQKILRGDSDETTAGRPKRLHLEKQYVLLYVTSYAERDVTVLDSKTSSVTPG